MIQTDMEKVTATELSEYVFCKHAWTLRRKGATASDQAAERMNVGTEFQMTGDELIEAAIVSEQVAKRAAAIAWRYVVAIAFLVICLYLLQR